MIGKIRGQRGWEAELDEHGVFSSDEAGLAKMLNILYPPKPTAVGNALVQQLHRAATGMKAVVVSVQNPDEDDPPGRVY